MKNIILGGVASFLCLGVAAQEFDPAQLSLAAGYKAAFTCSAHFNAGRSVDQIAGDELNRILPTFDDPMPSLPDAVIDEENKRVSVTYADDAPPRIAQWRPMLGCVQAPTMAADFQPPTVNLKRKNRSGEPWPIGDNVEGEIFGDTPQGFNIAAVVADAFDRSTYGEGSETTAVLIVQDGKIVAEKYRDGFDATTPQRTWSVAKSIAATIIGAAVHEGLIDVDEPAGLAAWSAPDDPRGEITLENLLHMSSGLTSPTAGNRTDDVYFGGGRIVDHAITNRLVAEPGALWRYANNDTMAAMRALRERMNNDKKFMAFPFKNVIIPLGMDHTFLETDWNGDFVLSSQVWTTARDLARLGLLYLNDGVWDGERILPEGWAAYVASPSPAQPALQRHDGSHIPGYGAQFWLYGERHGLPDGSYAARGNRGQYLMIIPERNVLIVRRGFDSNQPGGNGFNLDQFSADVLAALED
ncbi:serine hydrolase [Hyphococcus flavus]|uniref:Serine hydrolase n=1 Tax=Hyphococcus flavus TaxID=1866326 RepID=A0AAF0CDV0_9PROT|nr:serine hydrolase [Hyphococcus flavus]WDI30296.1 serine hydrolase [Hyphococcus flavus]